MSFNVTYIVADLSYTPAAADVTKVVDFLRMRGIIGEPVTEGLPALGVFFQWRLGLNADEAVQAYSYAPPSHDDPRTIRLFMDTEPAPIGDDGGPAFETRFFLSFVDAAEALDEFELSLGHVLGTHLFSWIGHY